MKTLRQVWPMALAVFVLSSAVQAHHSTAMFDRIKVVKLAGTVKEFYFANPHCAIKLVVSGAGGAVENWNVEMGSPAHLLRSGWKRNTIKQGDHITVELNPALDGSKYGLYLSATGPDGKAL
jgi:hypothetical protein